MLPTKTPCRFPANGVTSSKVFLFQRMDRRSAKKRRVRSQVKRKLLREVSAYSTVFPEQARGYELNCYLSCPMRSRLKLAFGSMPRVFRKAYFLPLSPRLIASSLSIACASTSVRCLRTPDVRAATPRTSASSTRLQVSPSSRCLSAGSCFLVRARTQTGALRLAKLDTEQPFSYCYELPTQHRLESVATRTPPPICTSALGSQTALVWRAWGAASDLRDTLCTGTRNR
jgi:hypothetical protein